MKPFAYQHLDWDYDSLDANITLPTARAVYEQTIKLGNGPDIDALYPDGTAKKVPTKWFKKRIKLDRKVIRAEIEASLKSEQKWWDEYQAKLAARDPNAPVVYVTGCSLSFNPPDTNVKARVARIVSERQWGWKTADEVDWAALEQELTK